MIVAGLRQKIETASMKITRGSAKGLLNSVREGNSNPKTTPTGITKVPWCPIAERNFNNL